MKSAIKWIIIITTSFIFLYAFSASYTSQNIDNLDYVIAIGIDTIPDSSNLLVTFEFVNISLYSENSSSEDSKPILDTIAAPSLSSAVNIMNAYAGKQLNLSHCKVIVFSDELAKKGILNEASDLMNNTQIRPTTNVLISQGNASEYLKNTVSSLEQILTKYYDIFPTSSEYTGYTSNIILGQFYESLINDEIGTVSILGKKSQSVNKFDSNSSDNNKSSSLSSENNNTTSNSNSDSFSSEDTINTSFFKDSFSPDNAIVNGDRGTENIGLCVFKDDTYIGNLTALDTLCYSLLKNEVDNFIINIDSPFNPNKKIDFSVDSLSSCDIDINTSKENPIISIKLNLTAKTLNGQEDLDFSKSETLNKLNESLKNYLTLQIKTYLNKTSKEYKADINDFYRIAKKNFLTLTDYKKYNWKNKYENAEFNIDINSRVISSLLIQNS